MVQPDDYRSLLFLLFFGDVCFSKGLVPFENNAIKTIRLLVEPRFPSEFLAVCCKFHGWSVAILASIKIHKGESKVFEGG